MKVHTIEQGECVFSVSHENGHFWETVWHHGENAALRAARADPSVLLPGDRLFVPDVRVKDNAASTNQRHHFVCRSVPARLQLRFLSRGTRTARAGVPYVLTIDGVATEGATDAEGYVRRTVSPSARAGTLVLNPGTSAAESYTLRLRHLDPVDTTTGAQARLRHLAYYAGPVDGTLGPATRAAIQAFQAAVGHAPTGELDDATRAALVRAHGS